MKQVKPPHPGAESMVMFGRQDDGRRAAAIRKLKSSARALFHADEDDAVVVNELTCTEPGCPPLETVIALLRAGSEPRQVKVHKAAVDVKEDDLRAAIVRTGEHEHTGG